MKEEINYSKQYCKANSIDWIKTRRRLYRYSRQEKFKDWSLDEKLEYARKRYIHKKELDEIKLCFNSLKFDTSNKNCRDVCKKLKINWNHITKLNYYGYNKIQMIYYIWYFYDIEKNGIKDISKKRLYEIKNKKVLKSRDVYYLISYYKCGHKELISDIFNYEEKFLRMFVFKASRSFNLTKDNICELFSEAQLILLKLIDSIVLNDIRRIIVYIKKIIIGRLTEYINKNFRRVVSFDESYMY